LALDLKRLGFFVNICEKRSLTAAARLSNVTQPVLSYHVAELERIFGEPLLHRRPEGVEPTDAGEALLVHARAVISAVEKAEQAMRSRRDQPEGLVSIGLLASIAPSIAAQIHRECRTQFPLIRLRISEGTSLQLRQGIDAHSFDLAVNLRERSELAGRSLLFEDLYFVARRGLVDLKRESLPLAEALGYNLLLPPKGHVVRELIEDAARLEGLTVRPEVEIEGLATLKSLVADGVAPSIFGFGAIKSEFQSGLFVAAKIARPTIQRELILHEASKQNHPSAAEKVKAIMIRVVQGLAR